MGFFGVFEEDFLRNFPLENPPISMENPINFPQNSSSKKPQYFPPSNSKTPKKNYSYLKSLMYVTSCWFQGWREFLLIASGYFFFHFGVCLFLAERMCLGGFFFRCQIQSFIMRCDLFVWINLDRKLVWEFFSCSFIVCFDGLMKLLMSFWLVELLVSQKSRPRAHKVPRFGHSNYPNPINLSIRQFVFWAVDL